jgi:cytochrome P450
MERAIADYVKSITWAMALTIVGGPRWTPYPGMRKARRGRDCLRQLVQELRTKVAQSASSGNDLLSLLIEANDPQTGRPMNEPDA